MTRRLTNQDAFDGAILHLLNQGHSCVSASGQARYRGPRGKSAIGALIPDELYVSSMEGKAVRHWLAAAGSQYDALRERLGGVTPSLLNELQDLHDRIGACMPSLYRQLAVAGAQRIAQNFKLSMSLVHRGATYHYLRGPQIRWAAVVAPVITAVIPTTADVVEVTAAPEPATPAPAHELTPAPAPELAAKASVPEPMATAPEQVAPVPEVAASTPVQAAMPLTQQPKESELDLIARGIAKAIAEARGLDRPRS